MLDTLDRMNTKYQTIVINAEDWQTLKEIAAGQGIPVNRLVNQILGDAAKANGRGWNGLAKHGGWRGGPKGTSESDDDKI
jgi:hypothetical protein